MSLLAMVAWRSLNVVEFVGVAACVRVVRVPDAACFV